MDLWINYFDFFVVVVVIITAEINGPMDKIFVTFIHSFIDVLASFWSHSILHTNIDCIEFLYRSSFMTKWLVDYKIDPKGESFG